MANHEKPVVKERFLRYLRTHPFDYFLTAETIKDQKNIQMAADLIWILADYYHDNKNIFGAKPCTNPETEAKAGFLYKEITFEMPSIKLVEWRLVSDTTTESIIARHNRKMQAQSREADKQPAQPKTPSFPARRDRSTPQPTLQKPLLPVNRIRIRFQREGETEILTLTETYIAEEIKGETRTDSLVEEQTAITRIKTGPNYLYKLTTKRKTVEQDEVTGGVKKIKSAEEIALIPQQEYITPGSINTTIAFLTEAILTHEVLPNPSSAHPYWESTLRV